MTTGGPVIDETPGRPLPQRESHPAPTLEMVAAAAGVSRATVSRVVNAAPNVSPSIQRSVNEAIRRLNYVPNRAARSLVSRRTQVIALVVPETTAKLFSDPFFATVVQGVALYLSDTEFTLNMLIASEMRSEKTRRYLLGGNADGALVVSHHSGDHSYDALDLSLPIVYGGRPLVETADGGASYFVDVDNSAGAAEATAHLLSTGRSRIATIAGPQDMPPGHDRLRGWRRTMTEAGRDDSLVEYGDFTPESGAAAMQRLFDRGLPIDGLFAANDQMAAGAYSVILKRGLRIPEDIAVAGFDNNYFGSTAVPALTTIDQPSLELGRAMAEVLVRRIEGKPVDRVTMMPTTLITRASTAV